MTAETLLKISQAASSWGTPVAVVTIATVCLWQARMLNGRLSRKISRDTCHTAMKALETKMDLLDEHQTERFEDLKDFLKSG